MIRHTVSFSLRHPVGSHNERRFLDDARSILTSIEGVEDFAISRQISAKSPHRFQFSMVFADAEAYAAYDAHPVHQDFVASRWAEEVEDFQELDFVPWE